MNSNIKNFIFQTYEIFKRDFWILVGLNICSSLIIHFTLDFHSAVIFLTVSILFFKNLSFVRGASIMPSVSSDFDRFSWKYYMGIPLNKKELIISLLVTNLIVMIPLFVWALCFFPQVLSLFESDISKFRMVNLVKGFILLVAFFSFTSLKSVNHQVINPRKKYSKISSKILFLQRLRTFLLVLTIGIYSIVGLTYIENKFDLELNFLFTWIEPTLKFIFHTWFIIPAAVASVVACYYHLIRNWQDEKSGYTKPNWVPKRDSALTTACLTALILPFFIIDFDTPSEYGKKNKLNKAVYNNNQSQVLKLIKDGHNVNKASSYGYTPAMVAIREGHFKMLDLLIKNGASLEGKISKKDFSHKGMNALHLAVASRMNGMVIFVLKKHPEYAQQIDENGNFPIHTAAKECRTDMLDTLLPSGHVNEGNKNGNRPLHMAVKSGCFAAISMLIEAGSDINAKNKDNKLASDYITENYKIDINEAYVLDKKLRAPASVKK